MSTTTYKSGEMLQSIGYRRPLSVRLSECDEAQVRKIAHEEQSNVALVCRQAIREYLNNRSAKADKHILTEV